MRVPISAVDPTLDNDPLSDQLLSARKALFVGAHPDDIEFYCAGTIHLMRERGAEVVYAIATRGGKGRRGSARSQLEAVRSGCQLEAARTLGVERVEFFDYPDKDLPSHVDELARDLSELISRENPDIVLSWDPDFIYNPHADHQAAADAARLGAGGARLVFYGTRRPNLWIGFDEQVCRIKLAAIRAHRTETPWYYWPYQKRSVLRRLRREGAKIGAPYAEVYRFSG